MTIQTVSLKIWWQVFLGWSLTTLPRLRKQILWRHGLRNVTWCLGWIFHNYFSETFLIISLWNWSILESSSSCKTNFYCKPLKHVLFRKRDIRSTLTQSVIIKRNFCSKTRVQLYNKQIYVIPLVDKKTEFLFRWKILVPNYSNDWGWRIHWDPILYNEIKNRNG